MKFLQFFITVQTINCHFIIKDLANHFNEKGLGENTEKYEAFSSPIEKKVTKTDKDGNERFVTISYKIY